MKTLNLTQGSQEWLDVRAKHFTASEAPAMLGLSKYMTRSELLRQKSTGIAKDIDDATQRRFDAGHEAEAKTRAWAEDFIGEELYPATGAREVEGLPLLASFDGLTMDESIAWENKLHNEMFAAQVRNGVVPDTHWPQMEQQLLVSGASKVLFTVSDGEANTVSLWYESDPKRRVQLIAGWKQFAIDLASYQHVETVSVPVVAAIDELPALTVELVGSVTASNMADWKGLVAARIQAINTDLKTDEDFAIAEKTVKFLGDGEKKLEMVKSQALSQTASIDELFRTIDALSAEMKAKRLNLDKLVKARKESIRMEIMQEGQAKLADHVTQINRRLGSNYISIAAADFATAIKGKKSVASLRDAVDTELARAKIAVSEVADRIEINKRVMETLCDPAIIFPDFASVCTKATDDFANLVAMRVTQHKEAEDRKAQARIQAEEQARIDTENAKTEAAEKLRDDSMNANPLSKTPIQQPSVSLGDVAVATAKEVFVPAMATASTMRELINDELNALHVSQLQNVLDYVRNLRTRRAA
jgi:predicted phage-related endonuclease